jgi:hypothetical protein
LLRPRLLEVRGAEPRETSQWLAIAQGLITPPARAALVGHEADRQSRNVELGSGSEQPAVSIDRDE